MAEKYWSAQSDEGCHGPGATVNMSTGLRKGRKPLFRKWGRATRLGLRVREDQGWLRMTVRAPSYRPTMSPLRPDTAVSTSFFSFSGTLDLSRVATKLLTVTEASLG